MIFFIKFSWILAVFPIICIYIEERKIYENVFVFVFVLGNLHWKMLRVFFVLFSFLPVSLNKFNCILMKSLISLEVQLKKKQNEIFIGILKCFQPGKFIRKENWTWSVDKVQRKSWQKCKIPQATEGLRGISVIRKKLENGKARC